MLKLSVTFYDGQSRCTRVLLYDYVDEEELQPVPNSQESPFCTYRKIWVWISHLNDQLFPGINTSWCKSGGIFVGQVIEFVPFAYHRSRKQNSVSGYTTSSSLIQFMVLATRPQIATFFSKTEELVREVLQNNVVKRTKEELIWNGKNTLFLE